MYSKIRLILPLSLAFHLAGPVSAQRNLTEIPDTNPAKQQESLKLAEGLELTLFAADPMIAKPIQMAFDAKGRAWLATSAIYPMVKPGQAADDKVMILEDTDHDGKADKAKAFCSNLLIPTGVWPAIDTSLPPGHPGRYNAAYLANSTQLIFARDTDGDGVMDDQKTVLAGFGTEDTHHILHMIKGMPDGLLYFIQSVYIHTHMETAFGTRRMLGSGIWQMDTLTGQAETFSLGQVNPWGHVWNRWGQGFTTDGAYGEGINHTFPGATFRCLPDQRPRILKGMNPGQPKQAGLEIVSGSHFPAEWQGNMITNDFRGHRVNRFALTPEGSSYSSQQMPDVVASQHGSFRPVDVRMGPDGGLYLADWYNPIIQHGEVDFRDERRDKSHGRVWRITAKGRPVCTWPDLEKATTAQLLGHLLAKEDLVRLWAKWELKARFSEKPQELAADLEKWGKAAEISKPEDAAIFLESLWTMQAVAFPPAEIEKAAQTLLKSPEPYARAAAVRYFGTAAVQAKAFPSRQAELPQLAKIIAANISDAHPIVRQESVSALRLVGSAQAVEMAMQALKMPVDTNLDYALWLTAWELADTWMPALAKGEITFGGDAAQLSFALKSAGKGEGATVLVTMLKSGKLKPGESAAILQLIAETGTAADLSYLLETASAVEATALPDALKVAVLAQLQDAAVKRKLKPAGDLKKVESLLAANSAAVKSAAASLAASWKLESARPALETLAKAGDAAGINGLALLGGPAASQVLTDISITAPAPGTKSRAIAALTALDADAGVKAAAALLAGTAGNDKAAAADYLPVIDAFLQRKDGPQKLAEALAGQKVSPTVATAALQRAGQSGGDTKTLRDALTASAGLQPMIQDLTDAQMAELVKEVREKGDPARGEHIYRRAELTCIVCHAIGNAGGIVGPNLVSLGASAPADYIAESLLAPSKKIKEGYATNLVTTKAGAVHTGFLARQDDKELLLRDAAGNTQSIPRADIAKVESIPVSLMPPGLTASLRKDEFVDLIRFLSELGKEGLYKTTGEGIFRRWRVLEANDALNAIVNRDGWKALGKETPEISWKPAYSFVNGKFPTAAAPKLQVFIHKTCAAQSEIEVTTPGKIFVKVSNAQNLKILFNQQEAKFDAEGIAQAVLPVGTTKVTLVWDHTQPVAENVTAEIIQQTDSLARAKPVGGL